MHGKQVLPKARLRNMELMRTESVLGRMRHAQLQ